MPNTNKYVQESQELAACGFSTIMTVGHGGSQLFNNGHIAVTKDFIFGLSVWDGDGFVPLTDASIDELSMVKRLLCKGTMQFPWWEQFQKLEAEALIG